MAAAVGLLLLLLAAGAFYDGEAAPRQAGLVYEDLTIKRANGEVLMRLGVDEPGRSRRLADSSACARHDGDLECRQWPDGRQLRVKLDASSGCMLMKHINTVENPSVVMKDCRPLGSNHWYGGGEEIPQKWPLEKYPQLEHAMVTMESANRGIQDPVWFDSTGTYIYVVPGAPLYVSINGQGTPGQFCLSATLQSPSPYRPRAGGFEWDYYLCDLPDAKQAFMHAVRTFLGKPSGYPDERMVRHPVWSTWARYKANINEVIVREFAKEIKDHGFDNSQLEIDDAWETCYGSKEVDTKRFPDMKGLTEWLKAQGFRVTIWTHPFINTDCPTYAEAEAKGFLVKNATGTVTHWWNGQGGIVDFTKAAAADWFEQKHKAMAEANGIDGFKFDAGETSWNPVQAEYNISAAMDEDYPSRATSDYVKTCARFNNLTEVRSAYRTQKLPIFVRMIDKDSRWGDDNGLKSLVTTLLQMNMAGYSMVLPDMIGGNQYNGEVATQELFLRWLQANTFMPALQYALVPWDYADKSDETVTISKKFNALHAQYTDVIVAAMKKNVEDGTPVNPPIWWLDPTDELALREDTEFLLGDTILSAPVLEKGAVKRDVYLPRGVWKDGNTGATHMGPTTIKDYPAPLDTLPYFIRQGDLPTSTAAPLVSTTPSASSALRPAALLSLVLIAVLALGRPS